MSHLVLFVCTGNICRSPMAAALFSFHAQNNRNDDHWIVRSAGTWAAEDQAASAPAVTGMARRGIQIANHRAHQITQGDMENADVIIVMTRNHRDSLVSEFPIHHSKIHLMSELDGREYDIADPYGGTVEEYEICAKELERLIERGYDRVKQWAETDST